MKILLALLCTVISFFAASGQERKDTLLVYFPFDSATLTPAARAALDSFVAVYKEGTATGGIALFGHCDSLGSYEYNEALSQRRVSAVQAYLQQKGLAPEAVAQARGYGERQPLTANRTPDERQRNRRVEVVWPRAAAATQAPPAPPRDSVPAFTRQAIDTVKEGTTLRLRNINFYGGRHTFLPQSMPALEELLRVMQAYPTLEIQIQGHICCLFGAEHDGLDYDAGDMNLSVNRARAVYDYLVENGIDQKRMTYRGFAATQPLVYPEYDEADRTANRRVEVKIVKK